METGLLITIGLIIGAVLILGAIGFGIVRLALRVWYKVPNTDEALVVSGKVTQDTEDELGSDLVVSTSKGMFVNPLTRRHTFISLRARQITASPIVQTSNNVTINVSGVATVKVGNKERSIEAAARRFASQDDAIEEFTKEQLEGSLRGVAANLTVKELMQERSKLGDNIRDEVGTVLKQQGLELDSFQIQSITDDHGYVTALGAEETERVKREASIAEINREREVNRRRIATDEENLKEETVYNKNKADSDSEVGQANARARQAEAYTEAEHEQKVLQQRADNRQAELDGQVKRQADAEQYRAEREADAKHYEQVKEAESNAEVEKRRAEADLYTAQQSAEARRVASEADAEATRNEGRAKAEAIEAEAKALAENQQALLAQRAIDILPELMSSWSEGYSKVGNVTIVGGSDSAAGSVASNDSSLAFASVNENLKASTGVDLSELIQGRVTGAATGEAIGNAVKQNRGAEGTASEEYDI